VEIEILQDDSLLALLGPKAEEVLQKFTPLDLSTIKFMTSHDTTVNGVPALINRCGYTGEDGFEISVKNTDAIKTAEALLAFKDVSVRPCGLAARDTLRLEAGLCLYGNDMDENISPVEASLLWVIDARRRKEKGFLGADVISNQIANGTKSKRVGFIVQSGPPARQHASIFDTETGGRQVGEVTSGTMGPTLKKSVGMCYVETSLSKLNTPLWAEVRGKRFPIVISKMPFVPHRYKK